ncbi:hypothetical protein [Aurantimonas sp. 22II-16-19i]|uniref:hypothetical protein n=1 Tax=Aurantimonas sp. 22II-16-19i TaxID=1317114 RepID=UPI0009F7A610|nr:hypothetical protein [Aurantimonas sp. 22II-16-19i]ORE86526.1 hypothetical protein ATO4_26065 [Aurantimonas sp. 22II-16-19i]
MIDPDDSDASDLAGAEILLPRLYKRDIDILLREEFLFGRPVQWLFLNALKLPRSAQFLPGWLSVADEMEGTDVLVHS